MADQNLKIPKLIDPKTQNVSETDLIIIISLSAIHILVSLIMLFKSIIQKHGLSIFVWIISIIVCVIILGFATHYFNGIKELNNLSSEQDYNDNTKKVDNVNNLNN